MIWSRAAACRSSVRLPWDPQIENRHALLSTIGAAKPSKNVQFDMAYAGFEKTHAGIVELDAALRGFIISLRGFHTSAQALVQVIDNAAGGGANTDSGGSSPSYEMKQFAGAIKASFVKLDGHLLDETVARYEKRILKPTLGWLTRANTIKHQVALFHKEKTLFDHHTRKVMALREARDKRAAAGKPEKPKDVEKLVRNEQKYAAITNTYAKTLDQTIANLRDFINARDETLTSILHRFLELRKQYAQQVYEESQKLPCTEKNDSSVADAVLGKLESLVTSSRPGVKGTPAAPTQEEVRSAISAWRIQVGTSPGNLVVSSQHVKPKEDADVPVQSFSFESFVGEAPPTIHNEAAGHDATEDENAGFNAYQPPPPPPPALASPPSPDGFFTDAPSSPDNATASPPPRTSSMSMMHSTTASAPFSASWDDISYPPKPSAPSPPPFASNFNTMPATGSSFSANPSSWGAFDDVNGSPSTVAPPNGGSAGNPFAFQTNFADLRQNALGTAPHQ
ncbi:hypothetical protein FI667_g12011, partial [Globisporangium splendens]